MQSLSFHPTLLHSTPFGRDIEAENGPARLHSKPSPCRPDEQSYPSPPMSDSHSPSRRLAQNLQSDRQQYPQPGSAPRMAEAGLALPPPSSMIFDPRSSFPASDHQSLRPLYHDEHQSRGHLLHYQPGRVVEPQSYGGARIPQNYAYGYPTPGVPSYVGPQHPGVHVQPAAMIAPPPNRPNKPARRTKAHVASACVNCKKAHLSCDVQRPCGRCVASGKQDTCKDVQHKKRGRPRLRDDREFARPEQGRQASSQLLGVVPALASEAFTHQTPYSTLHSHRASDLPRTLVGITQEDSNISNIRPPPSLSSGGSLSNSVSSYSGVSSTPYSTGPNLAYQSSPVAFLNLDLVIQKSNQAFQDLVSFLGDVQGKNLGDLVEPRQNEVLQLLRNKLRDERDEREPAYMAPITPVGQDPMRSVMESVEDRDVERVSQGFTDRPIALHFRLRTGQYQSFQTHVRLAKTSLYFATLVVRTPPRSVGPPLLTHHIPPTPARGSMSAPTTAPPRDYTPQQIRPPSSASSTSASPYLSFSSVRTSLPAFSPSSYGSSPSYNYSPGGGPEQSYFPTMQPPSQPGAYPTAYPPASQPRTQSVTSESLRQLNRPARLESLQLPPIRTGAAPLGSPLHLESSHSAAEGEQTRVRPRESPPAVESRPASPDAHKRRRLNIHEVLE
ncbi:hypothetical protein P153DRAFT_286118 [Dothidotthia symphoricarpi CBS 119687]|uniref:Zn(2)-C6 fungal-type domain-containing protein n=1 Tax=Dothidotthia symphoricarpi CBS 119687 TaxID=1392245 RepID=A0A6A6AJK9_9PLEO|nr:uncharacterized protein P153DRAFT_286118 [Dothidotthia symphoricarpi CBS 119687]KAF2131413.1 hypothetical protein P153DRAFT_286118 [Dothidotthia symphoricarpi CBS 119687]